MEYILLQNIILLQIPQTSDVKNWDSFCKYTCVYTCKCIYMQNKQYIISLYNVVFLEKEPDQWSVKHKPKQVAAFPL